MGQSQLTLIGRVEDKLALSTINYHARDQVANENEDLGIDEAFPEVVRSPHFSPG